MKYSDIRFWLDSSFDIQCYLVPARFLKLASGTSIIIVYRDVCDVLITISIPTQTENVALPLGL